MHRNGPLPQVLLRQWGSFLGAKVIDEVVEVMTALVVIELEVVV